MKVVKSQNVFVRVLVFILIFLMSTLCFFSVLGAASCERCLCLVDLYSCLFLFMFSKLSFIINLLIYVWVNEYFSELLSKQVYLVFSAIPIGIGNTNDRKFTTTSCFYKYKSTASCGFFDDRYWNHLYLNTLIKVLIDERFWLRYWLITLLI
jgi:hypothetical protein